MKLYQQVSVKLHDSSFKAILESFAADEVIEELCKVAESTFASKISPKFLSSAATKCQITKEELGKLIDCLALLMDASARLGTEPKEAEECLLLCGASAEVAAKISTYMAGAQTRLRDQLDKLDVLGSGGAFVSPAPAFHSLRWRFDVEVASRCLGDQIVPLVKLQLVTKSRDQGGSLTSHWLQTDPNNLRHLVESLEAALTASQTNHAQRIMRYVK